MKVYDRLAMKVLGGVMAAVAIVVPLAGKPAIRAGAPCTRLSVTVASGRWTWDLRTNRTKVADRFSEVVISIRSDGGARLRRGLQGFGFQIVSGDRVVGVSRSGLALRAGLAEEEVGDVSFAGWTNDEALFNVDTWQQARSAVVGVNVASGETRLISSPAQGGRVVAVFPGSVPPTGVLVSPAGGTAETGSQQGLSTINLSSGERTPVAVASQVAVDQLGASQGVAVVYTLRDSPSYDSEVLFLKPDGTYREYVRLPFGWGRIGPLGLFPVKLVAVGSNGGVALSDEDSVGILGPTGALLKRKSAPTPVYASVRRFLSVGDRGFLLLTFTGSRTVEATWLRPDGSVTNVASPLSDQKVLSASCEATGTQLSKVRSKT